MLCETEHRRANGGATEVLMTDGYESSSPKRSAFQLVATWFTCVSQQRVGGRDFFMVVKTAGAAVSRKTVV